jgi:hypothetical protein
MKLCKMSGIDGLVSEHPIDAEHFYRLEASGLPIET